MDKVLKKESEQERKISELEVIVFPRVYTETPELWVADKVVLIKGKLNCKDRDGRLTQEVKLLVDEASEITPELITNYTPTGRTKKAPKGTLIVEEEPSNVPKTLYMQVASIEDQAKLGAIKTLLEKHPGSQQAVVVIGTDAAKRAVKLPFGVAIDPSVTADLEALLGKQCVALR
jgi:DNA polymerase III alpha subunit